RVLPVLHSFPTRRSSDLLYAGIPNTVPCTTVNKVCASGMKAVMLAAQAIAVGDNSIIIAGGMENMSLIPHYIHLRNGQKFGYNGDRKSTRLNSSHVKISY